LPEIKGGKYVHVDALFFMTRNRVFLLKQVNVKNVASMGAKDLILYYTLRVAAILYAI